MVEAGRVEDMVKETSAEGERRSAVGLLGLAVGGCGCSGGCSSGVFVVKEGADA